MTSPKVPFGRSWKEEEEERRGSWRRDQVEGTSLSRNSLPGNCDVTLFRPSHWQIEAGLCFQQNYLHCAVRKEQKFIRTVVDESCPSAATMSPRKLLNLGLVCWTCIFYVHTSQAVKVGNILTQSNFFQTLEPTGEFMFQFDGDEIFHVDLQRKETKWRLPQFGEVASFDTAGALQNIGVLKFNLDIYEKRSNYTKAKSAARDDIHIYTEMPLVLGEPVTLVCLATQFFPPVIKMSWLKNNEPVTVGVTETVYYPAPDGSFSKFLYLGTVPQKGDVYTCSVEHNGLSVNPTNKFWYPEVPSHTSHSSKNVICGLGLAFGIFGIVAGIALIFKGRKNMNQARGH